MGVDQSRTHALRAPVWSPDGSWIAVNHGSEIYAVESDGTKAPRIPGLAVGRHGALEFSPTISPDGTRIAFSTFRHGGESSFDIASVSKDGTNYLRLTDNSSIDANPVWSPDGRYIAFVSNRTPDYLLDQPGEPAGSWRYVNVYVMASDGSQGPWLVTQRVGSTFDPPVWSPDSRRLAFLAGNTAMIPGKHDYKDLYTVALDGTDLGPIGEALPGPAWSPDGSRIAFRRWEDQATTLYTARPDGSDLQQVTPPGSYSYAHDISWSPDGSEIRFAGARRHPSGDRDKSSTVGIHAVKADGTGERVVLGLRIAHPMAWSPDGTRIAVFLHGRRTINRADSRTRVALYTMAVDGEDVQVLARRSTVGRSTYGRRIVAEHGDWREERADLLACGTGFVVPEPEKNPGLVRDCETLIQSRNALAGPDVPLIWNAETTISDWPGVELRGDPPRVWNLSFSGRGGRYVGLSGIIPPRLGNLEELEGMTFRDLNLEGPIPPELGQLSELSFLDLENNRLTGSIPTELGNLENLEYLDLRANALSGSIPPELGKLNNLEKLQLGNNQLTGSIPPQLGKLPRLASLSLQENQLTGCLPRELTSSPTLRNISHDGLEPC